MDIKERVIKCWIVVCLNSPLAMVHLGKRTAAALFLLGYLLLLVLTVSSDADVDFAEESQLVDKFLWTFQNVHHAVLFLCDYKNGKEVNLPLLIIMIYS